MSEYDDLTILFEYPELSDNILSVVLHDSEVDYQYLAKKIKKSNLPEVTNVFATQLEKDIAIVFYFLYTTIFLIDDKFKCIIHSYRPLLHTEWPFPYTKQMKIKFWKEYTPFHDLVVPKPQPKCRKKAPRKILEALDTQSQVRLPSFLEKQFLTDDSLTDSLI
jgi:hypothetical protein